MGACQSTSAASASSSNSKAAKIQSPRSVVTRSETESGSQEDHPRHGGGKMIHHNAVQVVVDHAVPGEAMKVEPLKTPNKREARTYQDRPGYSSGGSSLGLSSDEEDVVGSVRLVRSTRHDKLIEWKQELAANGDLTQKIVRIETDFGRNIDDVYEGVQDGPILGTGIAGVVRKVKHKDTGVYFAVKILNLGLLENDQVLEALREEIFIMCSLDHPNILRLEEVYESETQIFLIQELCSGGDLFDRLEEQPDYHYSEVQCAKLVKQMLSAVRYLHSKKIIHRDLKLENFLFDSKESDDLKMIDFGLSKHFKNDGAIHHDAVGTPYTVAPEIIKGSYDEKVDVWSMGVIIYLLLSGDSPFGGIDDEPLTCVRDNILKCHLVFKPAYVWKDISGEAKNFVRRLLTADSKERPTAREAQRDEWLQIYSNMDVEESKPLSSSLVDNLLQFKDYSDMHRVLLEVLSFTLLPDQIHELRAEFQKIDPDGEGEITLEELKGVLLNKSVAGSLGSLSEKEVEDIFNALRVKDSETTIRWHEFIAAGLSQCDIDDRNLRLAFDRLDYDRKGYITQADLSEMVNTSDGKMDSTILKMWHDGLKEIRCKGDDKITFEEFQRFLKGQSSRESLQRLEKSDSNRRLSGRDLLESSFVLQPISEGLPRLGSLNRGEANQISFRSVISSQRSGNTRSASVVLPPTRPVVNYDEDDKDLLLKNRKESVKSDLAYLEAEAYRTRQDFRASVLEASRVFDQMRQDRLDSSSIGKPASLTMLAGTRRPSLEKHANPQDHDETARLAHAAKKGGRRNRKNRKKTNSDLSMLLGEKSAAPHLGLIMLFAVFFLLQVVTAEKTSSYISVRDLDQYGNAIQVGHALDAAKRHGRSVVVAAVQSSGNKEDEPGPEDLSGFLLAISLGRTPVLHSLQLPLRDEKQPQLLAMCCTGIKGDMNWLIRQMRSHCASVWERYDISPGLSTASVAHVVARLMGRFAAQAEENEWYSPLGLPGAHERKQESRGSNTFAWARPLGVQAIILSCSPQSLASFADSERPPLLLVEPSGRILKSSAKDKSGRISLAAIGKDCDKIQARLEKLLQGTSEKEISLWSDSLPSMENCRDKLIELLLEETVSAKNDEDGSLLVEAYSADSGKVERSLYRFRNAKAFSLVQTEAL